VYRSLELTQEYVEGSGRAFGADSLKTKRYLESILTDEDRRLLGLLKK